MALPDPVGSVANAATRRANANQPRSSRKQPKSKTTHRKDSRACRSREGGLERATSSAKLGGEFHEVAKSHEEAARVDTEGGEVGEEDGKVETSMDETAAAASAPNKPSMPPEGRDGQDTTGNAGAGVHQPNGAQTGSPRRRDGTTTSVRNSAQSAGRADSTNTDHRQWREDVHMEDRGGSGMDDVKGHAKVQGGGYGGGRGSSDGTTNNTSGESRRLVLKALAEDEACQC